MGLEWEYTVEQGKESLKTSGPLHEAISVLVSLAGNVLWGAWGQLSQTGELV